MTHPKLDTTGLSRYRAARRRGWAAAWAYRMAARDAQRRRAEYDGRVIVARVPDDEGYDAGDGSPEELDNAYRQAHEWGVWGVVAYVPRVCSHCGHVVDGFDPDPLRNGKDPERCGWEHKASVWNVVASPDDPYWLEVEADIALEALS